jgi:hypothetical protein
MKGVRIEASGGEISHVSLHLEIRSPTLLITSQSEQSESSGTKNNSKELELSPPYSKIE